MRLLINFTLLAEMAQNLGNGSHVSLTTLARTVGIDYTGHGLAFDDTI